ncbi:MAG: TetR/AcrR family transcriptional regulator [Motiliproteus sp.]
MATSKATVQRILDTAVELFAQQGFEQVSVRDITTAAGVNLASVNYHFGSRDALVQAVAERYLTPLCRDMERQLDDFEASGEKLELETLLELLISAMLKAVEQDSQGISLFMRLLSQAYMSSDSSLRAFMDRRYGRSFRRLLDQFGLQLPELSQSEFYWRCHFLVGSAVLPLARYSLLSEQEKLLLGGHASEAEVFHRLVAFLAGGLRAEADLVTQNELLQQRPSPASSHVSETANPAAADSDDSEPGLKADPSTLLGNG